MESHRDPRQRKIESVKVDVLPFDLMEEVQRLVTASDVAEWLGISRSEVERLAEDGDIPGRKLRGDWRFGLASLNLWAEGRSLKAAIRESLRQLVADEARRLATQGPSGVDFDFESLMSLEDLEKSYIAHVLRVLNGNKSKAAEVLCIDPSTLYRKLKRYGL